MKLTFVRHGETEENVKNIIMSQLNGKLTKGGLEQARKLAKRLANEKFDIIYCSDSQRTKDTAKEIIKFHKNTPIIYTKELREIHRGDYIGKSGEELRKYYEQSKLEFTEIKAPNGESIKDMRERIEKFLEKINKKHRGLHVLFITHGGIKRTLWDICNKIKTPTEETIKQGAANNCAISILEFKDNKPILIKYNCTGHLK